jgi:hypothetical protein
MRLAIALLSALILCIPAAQGAGHGPLRFDGVYKGSPDEPDAREDPDARAEPDAQAAADASDTDNTRYCEYIRFYQDGTVINVTSDCDEQALAEIKKWFNKTNTTISHGRYRVAEHEVSFRSISGEGRVDYQGDIKGLDLHLASHSHINGYRGDDRYKFIRW